MKLLAIETSAGACSVALFDGSRQLPDQCQMLHKLLPMQQAKFLLPMIHTLLANLSIDIRQLDGIAYGCGPGSFTGIRLATSTAQALGYGLELPLIPVSSLAATAQTVFEERDWRKIIVCVDAHMERVYLATYEFSESGEILTGQEMISSIDEILAEKTDDKSGEWYGVGDGWCKYGDIVKQSLGITLKMVNTKVTPTALAVMKLARIKFEQKQCIEAKYALPVYLQ